MQEFVYGSRQFFGERRQHHPPSDRYQQVVLKVFAKPRQRAARSRLAQMNPLSCSSYILLDEEGIQYQQKIQIESAKVHGSLSKRNRILHHRVKRRPPAHRRFPQDAASIPCLFVERVIECERQPSYIWP